MNSSRMRFATYWGPARRCIVPKSFRFPWACCVGLLAALVGCSDANKSDSKGTAAKEKANASASTKANAAGEAYGERKPSIDPVKTNGAIFENWPRPLLALVITGEQDGYIEPCGCTGRENQLGGIARRQSFFKQLEKEAWPLCAVDLGGLVKGFGKQAEIKYQITADAMKTMGYNAIGLGAKDLRLPAEALLSVAAVEPSPFVSSNVNLFDLIPRYRVVEAGGKKIGITSVLGDQYRATINNDSVTLTDPKAGLEAAVAKLKAEKCDLLVLLSQATPDESRAFAKQFPDFDVVITAGGAEEPPRDLTRVEGQKTVFVEPAHKGKYAIVLGLYDDAKTPLRYQRVPLDARFPDSPAMQELFAAYQGQLEQLGFEGLGVRPKNHPRASKPSDPSGEFVGSAKCGECHKTAFAIWEKTKHARATESLAVAKPSRMFDPECLSCHVTGWSPQEFLPYATGFTSLAETPQLAGNGCENCHGPGGAHVAAEAEKKPNVVARDQFRAAMRLTKATAADNQCAKCHDGDNDPNFHGGEAFPAYWPKIEHKGKK